MYGPFVCGRAFAVAGEVDFGCNAAAAVWTFTRAQDAAGCWLACLVLFGGMYGPFVCGRTFAVAGEVDCCFTAAAAVALPPP